MDWPSADLIYALFEPGAAPMILNHCRIPPLTYAFILTQEGYPSFSGCIISLGIQPNQNESTHSLKFASKMPVAQRKALSWITIATSCNARALEAKTDCRLC